MGGATPKEAGPRASWTRYTVGKSLIDLVPACQGDRGSVAGKLEFVGARMIQRCALPSLRQDHGLTNACARRSGCDDDGYSGHTSTNLLYLTG